MPNSDPLRSTAGRQPVHYPRNQFGRAHWGLQKRRSATYIYDARHIRCPSEKTTVPIIDAVTPPSDQPALLKSARRPSSRRYAVIVLLVVVGVVAVVALGLVFRPQPLYQPSTAKEKAFSDAMMSDLIGLARQEALFYRINGRFTAGAESTFFMRSIGVNAPVVTVKGSAWYATVTHSQLPGVTCAIAVSTENPLHRNTADGDPVCR